VEVDVREASRGRERARCRCRRDVEHALAAAHVDGFAQQLADDLKRACRSRRSRRMPTWPAVCFESREVDGALGHVVSQ
jgi:hypothetical protein